MTDDPSAAASARECQVCPVCALLRAVRGTHPEVVEHLAAAGRELVLALRATLDAHEDGRGPDTERSERSAHGEHTGGLQRIRID